MRLNGTTTGPFRRGALAAALCVLLAACERMPQRPVEPKPSPVPYEFDQALPADARRFSIVPESSLVMILVYRAGTLAAAGHNHVVASHDVRGEVAFTPDVSRSRFVVRMPVATLTVDEPQLRRAAGEEFAGELSASAQEGTRRNMLSGAVLDAGHFPDVILRTERTEPAPGGALATVQITLRGETRTLAVPLRYEQKGDELLADGEFSLRQSDFGITPFTALLGAMRVQDEITVRFRIVARAAAHRALRAAPPRDTPCSAPRA